MGCYRGDAIALVERTDRTVGVEGLFPLMIVLFNRKATLIFLSVLQVVALPAYIGHFLNLGMLFQG